MTSANAHYLQNFRRDLSFYMYRTDGEPQGILQRIDNEPQGTLRAMMTRQLTSKFNISRKLKYMGPQWLLTVFTLLL